MPTYNAIDIPVSASSLTELRGLQLQPEGAPVYVTSLKTVFVQSYSLPTGIVTSTDASTGAVESTAFPGTYWLTGAVASAAAGKNRCWGFGSTDPAGLVVNSGANICAMKLVAKTSGIFLCHWELVYNALNTDLIELFVNIYVDAVAGVPLTFANASLGSGYGSDGLAQPGNVLVNNNNVYFANNVAGITVAGAGAPFAVSRQALTMGALPATAMPFSWTSVVGRLFPSVGNERPVAIGKTLAVACSVTNNHAAQSTNASMTGFMLEL